MDKEKLMECYWKAYSLLINQFRTNTEKDKLNSQLNTVLIHKEHRGSKHYKSPNRKHVKVKEHEWKEKNVKGYILLSNNGIFPKYTQHTRNQGVLPKNDFLILCLLSLLVFLLKLFEITDYVHRLVCTVSRNGEKRAEKWKEASQFGDPQNHPILFTFCKCSELVSTALQNQWDTF